MREYELAVIYDLELAEAEGPEASVQRVTSAVEAAGGTVKNVDHWGRRRMAYPINKAIDGDFIITRIEVEPENVASIESTLRIDERAYRSLVVRADELFEITPMQDRRDREPRQYGQREGTPAEAPAAEAAPAASAATETAVPAAEAPDTPATPETEAAPEAEATAAPAAEAAEAAASEAAEVPAEEPAAEAEEPATATTEEPEDEEKTEE